jgi:hypothetical protein
MIGTNGEKIDGRTKQAKALLKAVPAKDKVIDPKAPSIRDFGKKAKKIEIPAINIEVGTLELVGDSEICVHKWSEKSKKQMDDKDQGKAMNRRAPRNPKEEYLASLHEVPGRRGIYGFPAIAFKNAAVSACMMVDGIYKTQARGAFHVMGDILPLLNPKTGRPAKPEMRIDTVRIGKGLNKTAQLRYRGTFKKWMVRVTIRYNASVINLSQIANLLNNAGFSVGVGEWRVEKNGNFGMFHVGTGPVRQLRSA